MEAVCARKAIFNEHFCEVIAPVVQMKGSDLTVLRLWVNQSLAHSQSTKSLPLF
jgi:hypothetical protein